MNSYITELPVILDSFLITVVNTTGISIRVEGKGSEKPQNGEQRLSKLIQPNDINWFHFQLHLLHNEAKSMAYLTSQLCGDIQPSSCLLVLGR